MPANEPCTDNDQCRCQWRSKSEANPAVGLIEVTGYSYRVSRVTGAHYIVTRWMEREVDGQITQDWVRTLCKRRATDAERAEHGPPTPLRQGTGGFVLGEDYHLVMRRDDPVSLVTSV